ncbi:hypothetical protein CS063_07630 [Sporanaerobium hydrogeniformans]|uniref:Uncharacterized protein n=1 Tax=Sporanaerobium hydrogeniformans TaxID=3072179 RepID=A0AC61DDU5_9FIRM|nr:glycosyltransferase family 1 protein [Sporanaerobium hydrogeniformans]PHV70886.1 hypothetical protein CS063_07630 [Sporanaerobium hydrogeniformans]
MALHILIVAKYPESPSTLLGLTHSLSALQVQGKCTYCVEGLNVKEEAIEEADCLVFSRIMDAQLIDIMKKALKAKKQVFYYIDDKLFDLPEYIVGATYYRSQEAQDVLKQFMEQATVVITCNQWLKEIYEQRFKRNCIVIEPTVYLPEPLPKRDKQGKLTIGFAGNIDYKQSLEKLKNPLLEIYKNYKKQIQFEIFGPAISYMEPLNAIYYAPTYYDIYERILRFRQWDIGIALLEDTEFNNFKYYNKYLEYSRFGIAGVYSNISLYRRVITHKVNGLLAQNTEEAWYRCLEELITQPALRTIILNNSYQALQNNFLPNRGAEDFKKLFKAYELLE